MEFLKRILDYFDDDSAKDMVMDINDELIKFQDEGLINDEQRDALRHYLGTVKLADNYGGTVAWLAGIIHESTDILIPGEIGIQSQADRTNNNIALAHIEEGISIRLEDIDSYDKLMNLINMLEIPPPYSFKELPDNAAIPPKRSKPAQRRQTYNTGYHPELDTDE